MQRPQRFGRYGSGAGYQDQPISEEMRYLGVDITFEELGVNLGIECIAYIQNLCMKFVELKPIVLVLKKLLALNDMNSPYSGGLSSYSLVLMVSTYLYTCETRSMGKNLVEVLSYYGNYFNPSVTGLNGE